MARIGPIASNQFVHSVFNDSPIKAIPPLKKDPIPIRDTMEILEVANWMENPKEFQKDFSLSDSLYGKQKFHRPWLEEPKPHQKEMKTLDDINHLLIEEVDTIDPKKLSKQFFEKEISNLYLFIQCINMQDRNYKDDEKITFDLITRYNQCMEKLITQYFEVADEIISRDKTDEKLSWVNWFLDAGLFISGLASLALLLLTEGLALPVVVAYFEAFLSVSSGSLKITKGYLDYLNKKAQGLMQEIDFKRYFNSEKIRSCMKDMEESMNKVYEALELLEEIIKNRNSVRPFK